MRRAISPGDIGILFRTRESHKLFEAALAARGVPFYVYKGLGFFDADEIKDVLALIGYLADPYSDLRAAALMRSRIVRISDQGLKMLAPALAQALLGDLPADAEQLAGDDRERLRLTRGSVASWIERADQMTPAEVVDHMLTESAYAVELAGPGFAQARENLKKIRGLVRRIQNRGYATLERLFDYFAGLAAGGDESNAIIDAANAVNMMTVHAAKGLEFPVVFVVNIGKGSGANRDDIRVWPGALSENDEEGDPLVVISDHELAHERDDDKEVEETKRLLYVALTRARDRLYLAGTRTDGRLVLQRGSLGRVLPAALSTLIGMTHGEGLVRWETEGRTHVFRVVPEVAN